MRILKLLAIGAIGLIVAACGGGDGGSNAIAPTLGITSVHGGDGNPE